MRNRYPKPEDPLLPRSPVDDQLAARLMRNSYNKTSTPPVGAELIHSGAVKGVQFEIWRAGLVVYVVYPGTNEPRDWLRHVMFMRCKLPTTRQDGRRALRFHRAWMADSESTEVTIYAHLEEARDRGFTVCVVGHSYGGPLGVYLAFGLKRNGWSVALRTWGSPAPGNGAFARALDAAIPDYKRYANPLDLVTRVPFTAKHCGEHIKVNAGFPAHSSEKYFRWMVREWKKIHLLG